MVYSGESTFQKVKDVVRNIAEENAKLGKEIEANFGSELNESPKPYTEIDYSEINSAEITVGG